MGNDVSRFVKGFKLSLQERSIVQPNDDRQTLTERAYGDLTFAMRFFNERLFDAKASDCILSFGRLSQVLGYFCPDRFENKDGLLAHEISLNPAYLKTQSDREALATLVHEMCNLWRHDHGPRNMRGGKGSRGYHDKVWAAKMMMLGLTPISLDQPGKMTGYQVTHEIIAGGQFDLDCIELLANGYRIGWHDRSPPLQAEDNLGSGDDSAPPKGKKRDRVKFTCPSCGQNAWARPSAEIACTPCALRLLPEGRCGR